jgi:hypothetical protein
MIKKILLYFLIIFVCNVLQCKAQNKTIDTLLENKIKKNIIDTNSKLFFLDENILHDNFTNIFIPKLIKEDPSFINYYTPDTIVANIFEKSLSILLEDSTDLCLINTNNFYKQYFGIKFTNNTKNLLLVTITNPNIFLSQNVDLEELFTKNIVFYLNSITEFCNSVIIIYDIENNDFILFWRR